MQRSFIIFIVGLVLAILLVIFALQNDTGAYIKFLAWQTKKEVPVVLIFLISLALGVFIGTIFSIPNIIKKNKKIEELKIKLNDFRETQRQKVEQEDKDANTELEG